MCGCIVCQNVVVCDLHMFGATGILLFPVQAMSLNDNALDDRLEEDGRTLRWDACDVYDEAVLRELS